MLLITNLILNLVRNNQDRVVHHLINLLFEKILWLKCLHIIMRLTLNLINTPNQLRVSSSGLLLLQILIKCQIVNVMENHYCHHLCKYLFFKKQKFTNTRMGITHVHQKMLEVNNFRDGRFQTVTSSFMPSNKIKKRKRPDESSDEDYE